MNKRLYLFYQKETLKEFWKDSSVVQKILLITWTVTALIMGTLSAAITVLSSDKLLISILLIAIWLFIFPGLLLCAHNIDKSYWVELRENYALRHGDLHASQKTVKVSYEEAKYIVTGNVRPFIIPRRTSAEQYYIKYGNYINITDGNNKVILTVRHSEETLNILKEKCIYAKVLNIENEVNQCVL